MKIILIICLSLSLISCGGGSSTANNTVAGIAATGSALANAPVFIKDKNGVEPSGQEESNSKALVTTDPNGAYSFSSSQLAGLSPPFIVKVRGTTTTDSGDTAAAVFHSVVPSSGASTANLTQLTEAATILTLGADPKVVFVAPGTGLAAVTTSTVQTANQKLISALGIPSTSTLATLNVVSGSLDATTASDLSSPSAGKSYDMLLDSLSVSYQNGELVLSDANQSEDNYANGPKVTVAVASANPIIGSAYAYDPTKGVRLDSAKLDAFVLRFTQKLQLACLIPQTTSYINTCSSVINSVNNIFSSSYKHDGMSSSDWLKSWVGVPLESDDLSDVTVTLVTAFKGGFKAGPAPGVDVTRVKLKFSKPNGSYVIRSLLLRDDGTNVVIYGNQKDYFVWIKPQLVYAPDMDNTYPFNPKYEVGLSFIVKSWWAGQEGAIVGAHITGNGLPARSSTPYKTYSNADQEMTNPNSLSTGIEVFDRSGDAGCSYMAVDSSVYVEKNTTSWSAAWLQHKNASTASPSTLFDGSSRWKSGTVSCYTRFDFLRYMSSTDTGFVLPKAGDAYTVTLYLSNDSTKFPGGYPSGTLASIPIQTIDGDSPITVRPYVVTSYLQADSFVPPTSTLDPLMFPGIKDSTRSSMKDWIRGGDRVVEWTRPKTTWTEIDPAGKEIKTTFVNFKVSTFLWSFDQLRGRDSFTNLNSYGLQNTGTIADDLPFSGNSSSPSVGTAVEIGFQNYDTYYRNNIATSPVSSPTWWDKCGQTIKHKGSNLVLTLQKIVNYKWDNTSPESRVYTSMATCPVVDPTSPGNPTPPEPGFVWRTTHTNNLTQKDRGYFIKTGSETVYRYQVQRVRGKLQTDVGSLVPTGSDAADPTAATKRTLSWGYMIGKQQDNDVDFCSAFEGFYGGRSSTVFMIDASGRMIMERRDISADFPVEGGVPTAYRSRTDGFQRSVPDWDRERDITRPYKDTDSLYLEMPTVNTDYPELPLSVSGGASYARYEGERGVVIPYYKKSGNSCVRVQWKAGTGGDYVID